MHIRSGIDQHDEGGIKATCAVLLDAHQARGMT